MSVIVSLGIQCNDITLKSKLLISQTFFLVRVQCYADHAPNYILIR